MNSIFVCNFYFCYVFVVFFQKRQDNTHTHTERERGMKEKKMFGSAVDSSQMSDGGGDYGAMAGR